MLGSELSKADTKYLWKLAISSFHKNSEGKEDNRQQDFKIKIVNSLLKK